MALMIVLASTSRHRRDLLTRAGITFEAVPPAVDEEALKDDRPPEQLAAYLARAKAESIARQRPDDIIVGCDQVAVHRGEVLGKPGTRAAAIAQLGRLAGDRHRLVTAMTVMHGAEVHEHLEIAELTMRALSPEQIARYVDADGPLECCGSYRLESRGITLFETVTSSDHSAIVGLPLLALVRILAKLGVALP
ncbi:MAG TPA: nucleoside triphosphate pyrophosphatase [Myxococcota bacterium]|nr:nucleoside triphosphate pyrophosphatase [Myxococcota bacterium]